MSDLLAHLRAALEFSPAAAPAVIEKLIAARRFEDVVALGDLAAFDTLGSLDDLSGLARGFSASLSFRQWAINRLPEAALSPLLAAVLLDTAPSEGAVESLLAAGARFDRDYLLSEASAARLKDGTPAGRSLFLIEISCRRGTAHLLFAAIAKAGDAQLSQLADVIASWRHDPLSRGGPFGGRLEERLGALGSEAALFSFFDCVRHGVDRAVIAPNVAMNAIQAVIKYAFDNKDPTGVDRLRAVPLAGVPAIAACAGRRGLDEDPWREVVRALEFHPNASLVRLCVNQGLNPARAAQVFQQGFDAMLRSHFQWPLDAVADCLAVFSDEGVMDALYSADGSTLLHSATRANQGFKYVPILLSHGLDPAKKNQAGRTPMSGLKARVTRENDPEAASTLALCRAYIAHEALRRPQSHAQVAPLV